MIVQIITLVATLATALLIVQRRPAVKHTTLAAAWAWSLASAVSWITAAAASLALGATAPAVGQLWYVAAVLTLCPWIAVLGARRPTVRVWNWFVVAPLVAVLLWPVALCWMPRGPDRLILETPHLVGFALVLMMGTVNYWGTRFLLVSLIAPIAETLIILTLFSDQAARNALIWRLVAAVLIMGSIASASRTHRPLQAAAAWNDLWRDFRDTFGIVWANRIAERVNSEAIKGSWTIRLQPRGFVSLTPGHPPDFETNRDAIDQALRWLLRRFVDDEWMNSRMNADASPRVIPSERPRAE